MKQMNEKDKHIHLDLIYSELGAYSQAMEHEQLALNSSGVARQDKRQEIVPRLIFPSYLIWSLEQEWNLPISENRLVFYQQIEGSYATAIESDASLAESSISMSLFQRMENDFIQCYYSMKEFYHDVWENVRSKEHWQTFF